MELLKIIEYNSGNKQNILNEIKNRNNSFFSQDIEEKVKEIIARIKNEGDEGLIEITRLLDKNKLQANQLIVTENEFKQAEDKVDKNLFSIIKEAIERVKKYHQAQLEKSWISHQEEGMILGQIIRPLEKVGVYVPGGKAEYPSSLIMGAVPAIVAGVKEISVATPLGARSQVSPYLLMTARVLGISRIYKIGGAQAIAALAYGTETIIPVDKIVGPGNVYVTMAKKLVFGKVDIDMLAGPSEILIWADEEANPDYIVADLFSQAEHDQEAKALLVTTSEKLAQIVAKKAAEQIVNFKRRSIISDSLKKHGKIFIAKNKQLVIDLINETAPEHLELQLKDPWSYLGKLKNFGAVFLGSYCPEVLGDYWAGPNHVLPTMGGARQFSVLSVQDFLKRSSLLYCCKDRFIQEKEKIALFAELEELSAHAYAARIRK